MQPLDGLRVLDLGQHISGPLAGVLLADQGADVVSVLLPNGARSSSALQQTLSRGKRIRQLDLKTAAGLAEALDLASQCDVVIENFRPGVTERLGLGYAQISARNPDVAYVSLPGYARHDPRSKLHAYDSTISAACGLFTDLSLGGSALKLPPTYTSLPIPSVYAGLWGAIAAVSCVFGVMKGGPGDHIEVPLMDAAMSAAAGVLNTVRDQPVRYNLPPVSRKLLDAMSLQKLPTSAAGLLHRVAWHNMPATFRNYRCKDGRLLFLCVTDNASQLSKLLDITGLRHVSRRLGLREGDVIDAPPTHDNINAFRGSSRRWRQLATALAERFAIEDASVWAERLSAGGVPAGVQQTTSEWASMPVMFESGVLLRTESTGGTLVAPGPQVDVHGADVHTVAVPAPAATAAQRCTWLSERRFITSKEASSTVGAGAPLSGVRVADLCNVIAGPAAARVLAELGAEVIHVSPAAPKMGPRQTMLFGLDVNQGKRDVAFDLHAPAAGVFVERLLRRTDVVVVNKTPEQARRLGVAPDQVHAINPRAVVTSLTAYGGVVRGGWEGRPGYDPVLQALGGIMRRFGGDERPQLHGLASCIDYFTGFSAAFASIVSLIARERGSHHLEARTSLARTTGWIQLPFLNGEECSPRAARMGARGSHPLDRLYRAKDGYIHVHGHTTGWSALRSRSGQRAAASPGEATGWLAAEIRGRSVEDAVAWTAARGLIGQPVVSAAALRKQTLRLGSETDHTGPGQPSGVLIEVRHPTGDVYVVPDALWLRPSAGRPRLSSAPSPGQHSRAILRELGYDEREIQLLIDRRVAVERHFVGRRYLPE